MYTVNEVGCLLEFPAFKGRHFSLKVLNSPQVMHHEPFVKTVNIFVLHGWTKDNINGWIEVIGSSGQESLRLRARALSESTRSWWKEKRWNVYCTTLSKVLLTAKVPLTFVSTRTKVRHKQTISMILVSDDFALRSCETDYLTKKWEPLRALCQTSLEGTNTAFVFISDLLPIILLVWWSSSRGRAWASSTLTY